MRSFIPLIGLFSLSFVVATTTIPDKIYGVNLGSWLVVESWMMPAEWVQMGGEICNDCSSCIATEFAFAQAYPDTVDEKFEQHWNTWFTQDDVDELQSLGINTVRIPLGYWIVEALVNRDTEFYPQGGIKQLRRGLQQLNNAGIVAILDHHAAPGVQAISQQFAGQCTTNPQFYTDENYHRALVWAAVMTGLAHMHPDFSSVFAIEAVNEPLIDANQTPGYGDYQKKFVQTVRAMENMLGIGTAQSKRRLPRHGLLGLPLSATATLDGISLTICTSDYGPEICDVIVEATPILMDIIMELDGIDMNSLSGLQAQPPLMTNFMDANWQYNNPSNPAEAAIGPQGYDDHLYYSFGGVADATPEAYLASICNLQRLSKDIANNNIPLWFGEWSLATEFNATDDFLKDWADAQKMAYSRSTGWIFWSFKIESSDGEYPRPWSYAEGVARGYLTMDPSAYNNPSVCDTYTSYSS